MTSIEKPTLPKKRVGVVYRIVPGFPRGDLEMWPLCDQPVKNVAKIQYGSHWYKLFWNRSHSTVFGRLLDYKFNEVATELLRQPSTILLKGSLQTNLEIYGSAFMLVQTKLLPYVKIDRTVSALDAIERAEALIKGEWWLTSDKNDFILVFENENDLVGAKIAAS
ncbi:hypothetical protein [Microvirga yunnanensis]|uniref:hypothetical protein n=1 Tax=Microvirga yunnanensis TaxID=2953740 RepID=UPI0021C9A53C|nr:hypothetical protein [Microvirga sp. HBU65207]